MFKWGCSLKRVWRPKWVFSAFGEYWHQMLSYAFALRSLLPKVTNGENIISTSLLSQRNLARGCEESIVSSDTRCVEAHSEESQLHSCFSIFQQWKDSIYLVTTTVVQCGCLNHWRLSWSHHWQKLFSVKRECSHDLSVEIVLGCVEDEARYYYRCLILRYRNYRDTFWVVVCCLPCQGRFE